MNKQLLLKTALSAAFAIVATAAMAQGGISAGNKLYGTVMSSDDWKLPEDATEEEMANYEPGYGLYSFDGEKLDPILVDPYTVANGGGAYVDGWYHFNYYQIFYGQIAYNLFLSYNLETDEYLGCYGNTESYADIATQTAYDATTGLVYGQFFNRDRSGYVWGTRELEFGETQPILKSMPGAGLIALSFDNLGRAFAITTDGYLVQIDKNTGYQSRIGHTGLQVSQSVQTGAIDPRSGIFYFVAQIGEGSTKLYTIDLTTGQATLVRDMPGNALMAGAFFMPLEYADGVPAAPAEIKANFVNESLSGTVSVVAPTSIEAGKALVEGATVVLTLDGVEVASKASAPGETLTFEVAASAAGTHVFQAIAKNEVGEGRPATEHKWLGLDAPAAVSELSVKNDDYKNVTISWTAPELGIHGGYIDPAHLKYKVVDSEGKVVASAISETSCKDGVTSTRPVIRKYIVTSYSDETEGLSAVSNHIYMGNPYKVPSSWYFDPGQSDLWYVFDANDDGCTWSFNDYNRYWAYSYSRTNDADDWLFSPPVHLAPGQYYEVVSNVASEMTYYTESFELWLAKEQTPDGVVQSIRDITTIERDGKEERRFCKYEDAFAVTEEGDYFLAYHCVSPANQLRFELRSLEITLGAKDNAPAAPTGLKVRPGGNGSLSAVATFKTPSKTVGGATLTEITKVELQHDGKVCSTLNDAKPGTEYTLTDILTAKEGDNTYRVVCYNSYGKGLAAEYTVFLGSDVPSAPENVKVTMRNGAAYISWDPVTTGANGGYVNPAAITYVVARQDEDITAIYQGSETSCVDNTLPKTGAQTSEYYGVFAYYGTEVSQGTATPDVITGAAYKMPFEETFGSNSAGSLWLLGYVPTTTASWSIGTQPSYDSEDGNLTLKNTKARKTTHFVSSGKIAVSTTSKKPMLVFPFQASAQDRINLSISVDGVPANGKQVKTFEPESESDWTVVAYDLSSYKGQEVIFTFNCEVSASSTIILDDIRVFDDVNGEYTGIESVGISNDELQQNFYDLSGRKTTIMKGFVVNGGKVILK